jgi:tetratricopeptide (TPR) repeat protein
MPAASFARAVEHHRAGRIGEAIQIYRDILAGDPHNPDALHLLGMAAYDSGQYREAAALIGCAIAANPQASYYHSNLGNTLQALERFSEAVLCYQEALRLEPDVPEAHNNLGNALRRLGRLDESILRFVEALRLRPDYFQAYVNLGRTLADKLQFDDAAACFTEALRLSPGVAEVHLSLAQALLVTGRFENGWREFEWRWRLPGARTVTFAEPEWDGAPLEGKTILLWAEQGLGDSLQFVRYAEQVKQKGGRVLLECQPSLKRVFKTIDYGEALAYGSPLPAFDVQAPLQSLPRILNTTLETIPARVPYLRVRPEWRQKWRGRIGQPPGLKVGLTWAGNPGHGNDRNRSLPVELLAPLGRVRGVAWYSLQKDPPGGLPPWPLIDLAPELTDFADTAAAIDCLDLVISADTAVAHLAGALNQPVWTLIPFVPDYRWLLGREDSPWYPSMRLWRQTEPGGWPAVLERLAASLEARTIAYADPLRSSHSGS